MDQIVGILFVYHSSSLADFENEQMCSLTIFSHLMLLYDVLYKNMEKASAYHSIISTYFRRFIRKFLNDNFLVWLEGENVPLIQTRDLWSYYFEQWMNLANPYCVINGYHIIENLSWSKIRQIVLLMDRIENEY